MYKPTIQSGRSEGAGTVSGTEGSADRNTSDTGAGGIPRRPRAVWATAGASVVAFMGIGPVDPILPSIAQGLDATTGQVSLLFTSYFLITAVAMPPTGFVSSRIGGKKTLPLGLALVVVFAGLAGTSGSVGELVGFRAGRGLGNALFVSTALAVIVGAAAGGSTAARQRSCCTGPRWASAWPAGPCWEPCPVTRAGATRSLTLPHARPRPDEGIPATGERVPAHTGEDSVGVLTG